MSEEKSSEQLAMESKLALHREQLRRRKFRPRRSRSTLAPHQAERMKPFLDLAATGQDVLVEYADIPVAPSTLYRLILDSFLWLMQYEQDISAEDRQKYIVLRAGVYFEEVEEGFWIRHKKEERNYDYRKGRMAAATKATTDVIVKAKINSIAWKEDFMRWLETGEPTFERAGVALSGEDLQFIDSLCKTLTYKNKSTVNAVNVSRT